MTREERLKELGWISITEKMPPMGKRVTVCRIVGDEQGIWSQVFNSEGEVKNAKITHWGRR